MLNIACRGAAHREVVPLPSRHGHHARRYFRASWKRVHGAPRAIVIDGEQSLPAGEFPDAAEGDGTEVKVTSATSPWQAGKTERAGGARKETFYRTRQKFNAGSWGGSDELADSINAAIGETVRRGNFASYRCVFRRPLRFPREIQREGSPS